MAQGQKSSYLPLWTTGPEPCLHPRQLLALSFFTFLRDDRRKVRWKLSVDRSKTAAWLLQTLLGSVTSHDIFGISPLYFPMPDLTSGSLQAFTPTSTHQTSTRSITAPVSLY